jgi:3',5'-cyclic AMP phosphodiesterase CpdA
MFSLLHVSDLHFGPFLEPAVAEALLVSAARLKPSIIVASGDFTQRAKPEEFAAARTFLDRLPRVPLVTTPGNHDVPLYRLVERLRSPYGLYCQHISRQLDSVYRDNNVVIVALNSTKPLRAITNGRVSRQQLAYCEQALRETPREALRAVVAHHHFAPAPDYDGGQVMPQAQRALDRFSDLKVDLILGGHLHRAYIGNSLDVYPSWHRQRGIIIVQSGTSTSRRGRAREREKNSFNLIRVARRAIRITHYMYFSEAGGFAPLSRHLFPRASAD